ncbi:EI24 domain-containing protein [Comamonas sp. GB3 AK4-5]|uniref:EI24 domain-containing protein n=1 Tax=Comamonas sp. GB3 AK4-5 TaxID=3231487 RepID=UPI00351DCD69
MLAGMHLLFTSLARALGHCLHRKVVAWSLLPLLLMAVLAMLLSWLFWQPALQWTVQSLEGVSWLGRVWDWLQQQGWGWGVDWFAAMLLVLVSSAVLVLLVLMLVSLFMTPQLVAWVAERRFPTLERKQGAPWWQSLAWAVGSTSAALLLLVLSIPLWLIPPLVLVLPPLIWGWLTYRVMAFDALAEHASQAERQALFARHRMSLLLMGVVCGVLGAAPSVVWASGVLFVALFWLLVPLAIWIYALVLAFSSLWFAHFCLAALEQLRQQARQGYAAPVEVGAHGA